jgi:hypothetical protein
MFSFQFIQKLAHSSESLSTNILRKYSNQGEKLLQASTEDKRLDLSRLRQWRELYRVGLFMARTKQRFLSAIVDAMRNLFEFLRGPQSKMIPGARLPVIDRFGRCDPRGQVQ